MINHMKKFSLMPLVLMVGLLSCSSEDTIEQKENVPSEFIQMSQEKVRQAGLETGLITVINFEETLSCTGMIDVPPMGRRVMHSFIAAQISTLNAIRGQYVQKGDVLATLRHPNIIEWQEALLQAKSDMMYYTQELARKQDLRTNNTSSIKEVSMVQNALEKSRILYQSHQAKLKLIGIDEKQIEQEGIREQIIIQAPFSGKISNVMVQNGTFVSENQPLLELLDVDHKHIELDVFMNDAPKVQIGQIIRLRSAGNEKILSGEVYLINPDLKNNSLRVHGHLANEADPIQVGTFLEAEIVFAQDSVYAIDKEELIREGENFFLHQVSDEGYKKVAVQVGRTNDRWAELINFDASARWVLKGNYYLRAQ